MTELKQVYQAADGTVFNSKREAEDHQRRPQQRTALMTLVEGNEELADWLLEHKSDLEENFDIGTVRRVTKSERNKLTKALEALKEEEGDNKKYAFLIEHSDDIIKSFKWPGQKRLTGDDKDAAIKEALTELVGDDNLKLADYIVAKRDDIVEAFNAGKPKREVTPQALEGLRKYQEKMKAEKEAKKAAEEAAKAE